MSIDSLSSIQIEAMDPEEIAGWLQLVLAIDLSTQHEGGFYGVLQTGAGPLQIGILPTKSPFNFHKNTAFTFHSANLVEHLALLQSKKIKPDETMNTPNGTFAFFTDPEGNKITLWG